MKYSEKQILFKSFLDEWGLQFSKISPIIKYISSYPELTSKLKNFKPLAIEDINESQLEWVSLVSLFDNSIEVEFFKPYWVPIQSNSYDYFIDLSSNSFPIFEINYFYPEPYRWDRNIILKDISEFLASVDDPSIDIDKQISQSYGERRALIESILQEMKKLGLDDNLGENSF